MSDDRAVPSVEPSSTTTTRLGVRQRAAHDLAPALRASLYAGMTSQVFIVGSSRHGAVHADHLAADVSRRRPRRDTPPAAATSSGVPARAAGTSARTRSGGNAASAIGDAMIPGATALTVTPRFATSMRERLGRTDQACLGRGVVHLAGIAGDAGEADAMLTMRPQRVAIMSSSSGRVTLKKPSSVTSSTRCHCSRRMPAKRRVVVHAGVVDDHLHRTPSSSRCCVARMREACAVGDVERHRLGAAAVLGDRAAATAVARSGWLHGMHDHMQAVTPPAPRTPPRRSLRCLP